MNNEQFRRLLLANAAKSSGGDQNGASASPARTGSAGAAALGSRQKSSIPMTPRSVAGAGHVDFARQLAERDQGGQSRKKFRSFVPKGSKFSEGYVDRAKTRQSEEEDDRATRIKALEEALKKEEIDQATFEKLRSEIAGGDLTSTHLIKGLDFKLLERVRKGEDVYSGNKPDGEGKEEDASNEEPESKSESDEDIDDAFEELEGQEVAAVAKEKKQKKGQLATTSLVPGKKRTRDQILAELKAAREAAKAKEESSLGTKFKKIGGKKEPGTRIERDGKGREVLIIVDEDGHERRKVRKVAKDIDQERDAFKPDPSAKPLGMEVPEYYKKLQEAEAEEEEEVHVFSDVGSDYDPLAGIASDSDDSDDSEAEMKEPKRALSKDGGDQSPRSEGEVGSESPAAEQMPPPPKPQEATAPRNYFKDSKSKLTSEETRSGPAFSDPAVIAALRKAKVLNAAAKSEEEAEEAARQDKLKKLLASSDRDAEDMDMGFGTNRIADEEDMEETKVKLSAWGGGQEDDAEGGGGRAKRKRGPKKKKGDVNNIADVMSVIEKRKAAGSK